MIDSFHPLSLFFFFLPPILSFTWEHSAIHEKDPSSPNYSTNEHSKWMAKTSPAVYSIGREEIKIHMCTFGTSFVISPYPIICSSTIFPAFAHICFPCLLSDFGIVSSFSMDPFSLNFSTLLWHFSFMLQHFCYSFTKTF